MATNSRPQPTHPVPWAQITVRQALLVSCKKQLATWCSQYSLRIKILVLASLTVSMTMTGVTFFAISSIKADGRMTDTRFARDLALLISANVTPLIAEHNYKELASVTSRFWYSTKSLRYVFFANPERIIYLGIPMGGTLQVNELLSSRRLQLPIDLPKHSQDLIIKQHLTSLGQVTDVFVPIISDGEELGLLVLGTNPNDTVLASVKLTREITVVIFTAIWALVIFGVIFNTLTLTHPVKELLRGVRAVANGDFQARIVLSVSGELGELVNGFNDMASQLEVYERANIEEVTAAQVKQQSLIATMADGAVLLDAFGRIVLANPTARRLFHWEGRNLEGQDLVKELPTALALELSAPLIALVNGSKDITDVRCKSGKPVRTLRIVLQSVKDASGTTVKGIAMTIQDLTREVELNAAQNRFISNVSHELRTPLFNIKSYVETLYDLKDQLSEKEKNEFLSIANEETDRLTRLVNNILDLSKLESGRVVSFEIMELKPAMDQTLRNYRLNAKDKSVELVLDAYSNELKILGNWDLLLQAINNLVGNALKFTENGGRLILKTYPWPEVNSIFKLIPTSNRNSHKLNQISRMMRVEIADTGCGISLQDQSHIFERFYRVENTVHTETGTGLGLSIVRGIVEKHSSCIKVVSKPGVGTTFWFDLTLEDSIKNEPPFELFSYYSPLLFGWKSAEPKELSLNVN
uniref:Uncharacterized sensor-like histidine kinase ycf26 n=1 Tax=Paulinella chromatophora TaxID=39717 RepID=B1X5A6_PAUCH|nr:multi-sensor signal transduction histidine kinase [Paulinella chromatophora]ACB43125.1 multi-sensor signal transduction histidine kinase [Paulinella chromatophora]